VVLKKKKTKQGLVFFDEKQTYGFRITKDMMGFP
jgi:hypothetical protein